MIARDAFKDLSVRIVDQPPRQKWSVAFDALTKLAKGSAWPAEILDAIWLQGVGKSDGKPRPAISVIRIRYIMEYLYI
jgi:hypothetical protein